MSEINLHQLGLTKAEALRRLFNASQPLGMGFLQPWEQPMSIEEATELTAQWESFDYVRGRIMKIHFRGNGESLHFDPSLYDRDNGEGAALRCLASGSEPHVEAHP